MHEETFQDKINFFILFSSIASVLGNRNQANYKVGNDFLNAIARLCRTMGLPGVSVALGATSKFDRMGLFKRDHSQPQILTIATDIGVLANIGVLYDLDKANMLETLSRSGLSRLESSHLDKIMVAAVLRSRTQKPMDLNPDHSELGRRRPEEYGSSIDDSLIVTGLEMFDRLPNGELKGRSDPIFWTNLPESSYLMTYIPPLHDLKSADMKMPLKQWAEPFQKHEGVKVDEDKRKELQPRVTKAFRSFLSDLLGYGQDDIDTTTGLATYGLDSLGAVGCQYWLSRGEYPA